MIKETETVDNLFLIDIKKINYGFVKNLRILDAPGYGPELVDANDFETLIFGPVLGLISSTFYVKLLRVQIPKAQKGTDNLTEFLCFWDLRASKLLIKCW